LLLQVGDLFELNVKLRCQKVNQYTEERGKGIIGSGEMKQLPSKGGMGSKLGHVVTAFS
jgi:hypothetical protein